jgi:hypothetical protein
MALARQSSDLDEGLAILTEMIVREIGPPSALAKGEARAAAVARVERLLETLMDGKPSRVFRASQDRQTGAAVDRKQADFAFAAATPRR